MPTLVTLPGAGRNTVMWALDGRLVATGPVSETDAVKADRELEDVPARLKHMDELGTDIQVIFPTIFLRPLTTKPRIELLLSRSYNRYLGERCERSGGRLRWAVVPPTMSIDESIEELRWGKEHGACAVFWRGIEQEKLPGSSYFDPIYAEAERLDLPICIHAATGNFTQHDLLDDGGIFRFKVPGITAFHNVLSTKLPDRFPRLRFGFIELAAQWVPYCLHDFVRRGARRNQNIDMTRLMADNRMYVACQTDDDIAYVLRYAGDNNLVSGTDYGHADTSSELLALQRLREREDVRPEVMDNILNANPKALYGLA
jgi:predicted TIM-barrel fold metal-dependent hydrolase